MSFTTEPQKMTLVNLVTNESRSPMYNPAELTESITVNYSELQVLGLSHPVQHYVNTSAVKFDFELTFQCIGRGSEALQRIQRDRLFLKALTHPWRSNTIARGGPPRVLFIWPNLLSLTCLIKSLKFSHTQFNPSLGVTMWKAALTIDEVRDVFVGMDDILNSGDDRGGGATPPVTDIGDL